MRFFSFLNQDFRTKEKNREKIKHYLSDKKGLKMVRRKEQSNGFM